LGEFIFWFEMKKKKKNGKRKKKKELANRAIIHWPLSN
jgi:hypothetical protein